MLSLPGGGDEDNDGVLPRKLAEDDEQLIDPQVGEIVKFFNEFVGEGGTTYTATIMSIYEEDGKMMYEIEYVDESTHAVTRITTIDKLSAMPQPARKFVEFGHDELKLIWKPDVHITNLHLDMNTHEEVNYLMCSRCLLSSTKVVSSCLRTHIQSQLAFLTAVVMDWLAQVLFPLTEVSPASQTSK